MSLLWVQAMAWGHDRYNPPPPGHPISVRRVGFAGHVGLDHDEEDGFHDSSYDEDLYDEVTPEPTAEEEDHHWEHNEYPESFYERHHRAYETAMQERATEDRPDHLDIGLGNFVKEHAGEREPWEKHGEFGDINLKQPIHAIQSHVHSGHLDRYDKDPSARSWQEQNHGAQPDYLANQHPLFATHEGRLHVIDGTHRVGAALRRGDASIKGWHIDLDKHSHLTDEEDW